MKGLTLKITQRNDSLLNKILPPIYKILPLIAIALFIFCVVYYNKYDLQQKNLHELYFINHPGPLKNSADAKQIQNIVSLHSECFVEDAVKYQTMYLLENRKMHTSGAEADQIESKIRKKTITERSTPKFVESFSHTANVTSVHLKNELVGLYSCSFEDPVTPPGMYIYNVCTAKAWRGKGIGRKLINHSVKNCHKQGSSIYLTVYEDKKYLIDLYQQAGFKITIPSKKPNSPYFLYQKVLMEFKTKQQNKPLPAQN